ncbi:MAG: L-2-amino-thiazoline-4-carboxylic acid hydrolase [Candidatus Eisenbacteria bacterium]|nr:L-2-amino-thiazoline-4-carboxylic acid hydrolase [Candidatus Eisenbacteria bacterium]
MGNVLKEFPQQLTGRPPEKVWAGACRSYGIIWGQMGRAVVDAFGAKGAEALREGQRRVARMQVPKAFESGRFERNAKGMAEYMLLAEETLGMKVEMEPGATAERAVFRWLECPLFDDAAKESTPELCRANDEFEMEAVKLVHPQLTCTITKCRGNGDDCCEMVFEMKK